MIELARKTIGINLDDNDMNNANSNFIELYGFLGFISEAKKSLENFLNGSGVVTNKMLSDGSVKSSKIAADGVFTIHLIDKIITNAKLAENSVSAKKTTFIDNLLVHEFTSGSNVYQNGVILNASAGNITRMIYNSNDFPDAVTLTPIKVESNKSYEIIKAGNSSRFRIALFDHEPGHDSVPTQGFALADSNTKNFSVTTGKEDKYMAIQVTDINEKPSIKIYETTIKEGMLSSILDNGMFKLDKFSDGSISPSKTSFINRKLSKQVDNSTSNLYITGMILNTDSGIVSRVNHNTEKFPTAVTISPIPVQREKIYIVERLVLSDRLRVALFDHEPKDQSVPTHSYFFSASQTEEFEIMTKENDKYMAIQVSNSLEKPAVNVYKLEMDKELLPSTSTSEVKPDERPIQMITGNYSDYYKSVELEDMSVGDVILQNTDINYVYGLYDQLMTDHPNRFEKRLIGYGGNSNNAEDTTLPIYEYHLKTPETLQEEMNGFDSKLTVSPTILITTGVHGVEKAAVYGGYQFFKQLLDNPKNDNSLLDLVSNFNFKIIPVVNPGGYNAKTRNNLSDVNINRDFVNLTQIETRHVDNWMDENKDAFAYLDFHNFSRTAPARESSTTAYHLSQNHNLDKMFSSLVRRLSNQWRDRYIIEHFPDTKNVAYGYIESNHYKNTHTSNYGAYHNHGIVLSSIPEATYHDPKDNALNTKTVLEINSETLINYVLALVDAFKD